MAILGLTAIHGRLLLISVTLSKIAGRGYRIYLGDNEATVESKLISLVKSGEIRKGDIIQRLPGSAPGHTMIINEANQVYGITWITYHSTGPDNWRNRNFDDFPKSPGQTFVAYHLHDSFSY